MLLLFLITLIVYSIKKVNETCCCSCSRACKEKKTGWILRIFTFNDKNLLYLPLISTLQFFWGSEWSRSDPISHKHLAYSTLRKTCPYSELFWSTFSQIRITSPYSVRMRENVDQNNSEYAHFSSSAKHQEWLVSAKKFQFFTKTLFIFIYFLRQYLT